MLDLYPVSSMEVYNTKDESNLKGIEGKLTWEYSMQFVMLLGILMNLISGGQL